MEYVSNQKIEGFDMTEFIRPAAIVFGLTLATSEAFAACVGYTGPGVSDTSAGLRSAQAPLVAATIRAVAYLVPDLRPFLAPDEGPRADDAKLAGQVALLAHLRQG